MEFILKHKIEIGLLFIPVLVLIGLRLLGFDGLYGQDSYEYLRYSIEIKTSFLTGIHPGHSFWPAGYPMLVALFSLLIPASVASQLVSLLSLYGVLYFIWRLIILLYKEHSNVLLFLFTALLFSPYMLRGSLVSMSDIPAAFWLMGSVFFAVKYYKVHGFKEIFLSVLFGSLSIFTRYAAIVPVAIIFVSLAYSWLNNKQWLHLLSLLLPIGILLLHLYFYHASENPVEHFLANKWSFGNYIKTSFVGADGAFSYFFPNIIYVFEGLFHPGFFIFNIILLFVIVRKKFVQLKFPTMFLGLVFLLYSLFLAGIPFQTSRFLLLTYPLVLVVIYPGFDYFLNQFGKFKPYLFALLIVLQLALFTRALAPTFQLSRTEKNVASIMKAYQNQILYSFELDVALQGRGLQFDYRNLWTEKYLYFETGALVLFNPEKFEQQWESKNPMVNWNHLKERNSLQLLDELDSGWKIYRIEE